MHGALMLLLFYACLSSDIYLRMRLQLFFKVFFVFKYIKIIFFLFLKIIFEISISKQSKTYKKINF